MTHQITTTPSDMSLDTMMTDVQVMQTMCERLMKTKHYQSIGEAGLFAIIQKAKSLNVNPLEALNGGLYYVQGKVGMSSEMMSSLIRGQGHSITKDAKSDNSICILHGRRADTADTWTVSFSMEDAKRAGLARGMYDKYPSIMLYNRAMSMLARQLFPDVIKGAGYTHEELSEIKNASTSTQRQSDVIEIISSSQAIELLDVLSDCDTEYQASVQAWIKKPPVNADSIHDLPAHLYDRILNAAIKKRDEAKVLKSEILESQKVAVGE